MFKAICAILAFLNSNALFQQSGCYPSRGIQTTRGLQYHIYIYIYIHILTLLACALCCAFVFSPPVRWGLFDFMSALLLLLLLLLLRRTSTASSRSQWSPPDPTANPESDWSLNCKLVIAVVPTGQEWFLPDLNWSPPDLNSKPRMRVVPVPGLTCKR